MRELHRFHGGLKLDGHKSESLARGLQQASLPARLYLPLRQHIGEYNKPLVDVGDRVLKGHIIAAGTSLICASVHAPTSGRIAAIENHPVAHPSGQSDTCIVIDVDGADEAAEAVLPDLQRLDAQRMIELICRAGIVGRDSLGEVGKAAPPRPTMPARPSRPRPSCRAAGRTASTR